MYRFLSYQNPRVAENDMTTSLLQMLPSEDPPLLSQHHQVDLTAPPNHLKRSHHELKPKPWKPFRFGLVLLMEEIQANQLIWQISRHLQGFTDIRTGAVFLPSTISSEIQGNFPS